MKCSRSWSRDFPAACAEDCGEAFSPPAPHGGPSWSRYTHCRLWRISHSSRWMCCEGNCETMEISHWSRLLTGTVGHGEKHKQNKVLWE